MTKIILSTPEEIEKKERRQREWRARQKLKLAKRKKEKSELKMDTEEKTDQPVFKALRVPGRSCTWHNETSIPFTFIS